MLTKNHIPFSLRLSSDAEIFEFTEHWDHKRHYQAVFNAQFELLPKQMNGVGSWAMVADWRNWLVHVPESERLCIRCVNRFVELGMTHYGVLIDEHPVAKWQAQKVIQANPSISSALFYDIESSVEWLQSNGFGTNFRTIEFESRWMSPSKLFDDLLQELDVDKTQFSTT